MPQKNTEHKSGLEKQKTTDLTSEDVSNAHAAGDGAVGRSKEAITEEDVHPEKRDEIKDKQGSENY